MFTSSFNGFFLWSAGLDGYYRLSFFSRIFMCFLLVSIWISSRFEVFKYLTIMELMNLSFSFSFDEISICKCHSKVFLPFITSSTITMWSLLEKQSKGKSRMWFSSMSINLSRPSYRKKFFGSSKISFERPKGRETKCDNRKLTFPINWLEPKITFEGWKRKKFN